MLEQQLLDPFTAVDERPVATLLEHVDLGRGEGLALALGEGSGHVGIALAPDHEGGAVETHLTQAYGKLEIGSREELPEALAQGS